MTAAYVAGPCDRTVAGNIRGVRPGRIIVVPCSLDTDPEAMRRSNELFAREVLPELV